MSHLRTLRVLQHRESWRDSTCRLWSFEEAEFPGDAEVALVVVLYNSALSPFSNLEMQHNKKRKRSVPILFGKSYGCKSLKKGFASSTKMDVISQLHDLPYRSGHKH
jgi:hypothetical protein